MNALSRKFFLLGLWLPLAAMQLLAGCETPQGPAAAAIAGNDGSAAEVPAGASTASGKPPVFAKRPVSAMPSRALADGIRVGLDAYLDDRRQLERLNGRLRLANILPVEIALENVGTSSFKLNAFEVELVLDNGERLATTPIKAAVAGLGMSPAEVAAIGVFFGWGLAFSEKNYRDSSSNSAELGDGPLHPGWSRHGLLLFQVPEGFVAGENTRVRLRLLSLEDGSRRFMEVSLTAPDRTGEAEPATGTTTGATTEAGAAARADRARQTRIDAFYRDALAGRAEIDASLTAFLTARGELPAGERVSASRLQVLSVDGEGYDVRVAYWRLPEAGQTATSADLRRVRDLTLAGRPRGFEIAEARRRYPGPEDLMPWEWLELPVAIDNRAELEDLVARDKEALEAVILQKLARNRKGFDPSLHDAFLRSYEVVEAAGERGRVSFEAEVDTLRGYGQSPEKVRDTLDVRLVAGRMTFLANGNDHFSWQSLKEKAP